MHPGKSLIDSLWPSRQTLRGHCVHIMKSYFPAHHHGSLDRQSIRKQNHGPMQKVTIEMQLRPLWPRHDWHNSMYSASTQNKPAQQWSQETCRSMNVNMRNTGWVKECNPPIEWWVTYFLAALCLCVDSQIGSDGGGTGPSHDLCRHSLASDSDSLFCLHVKHLLEESHAKGIMTKCCSTC